MLKLPNLVKSSKGFTLIELMVVMVIIAILATIGIVLFNNTQQTARDSKRTEDIHAISTALETHFQTTIGTCPDSGVAVTTANTYCPVHQNWFGGTKIPVDPKESAGAAPSNPYCIIYTVNAAQANTAINDPTNWNGAGCPGAQPNFASTYVSQTTGLYNAAMPANMIKWKVCATLENLTGGNGSGVFCASNQQQ